MTNEDIVISGIGGRYPNCDNLDQFKAALLDGVDLVTEDDRRFKPGLFGTPKPSGKINNIDVFDANFFGVSHKQADFTDSRQRILLETVFEAIVDAGINPRELRGSRTGVYVACHPCDVASIMRLNPKTDGYANIGLTSSTAANRASFSFDFKGPSFSFDASCSSGLNGIEKAIKDMQSGDCDHAVVSTLQINLHPLDTFAMDQLKLLSSDGKCKLFSKDGDGFVRSEAIVTVLLQKKSTARRNYGTVIGAAVNVDGYKPDGLIGSSKEMHLKLLDVYEKYNINPNDIKYFETNAVGSSEGDRQECEVIVNKLCKNRKEPLLIGGVKSNMGHAETSASMCAVSKIIIAMETGIIPKNLHYTNPDKTIPGIKDGTLKVVDKNTPWNGGLAAVNSFGMSGANGHLVIKSNEKSKVKKSTPYRLVQVSGRSVEAVNHFLDNVEKNKDDPEFLALVDEVHKLNVDGHNYRGYIILGDNKETPVREISKISYEPRPLWFIYTGMGSQWPKMGKDLMKLDIFRNTIERCAKALKPYNIDLVDVLVNGTAETFTDNTNSFVCIAAVEIALTDVLRTLGLVPDGLAGHSLGEVGASYGDGCVKPEEAVLLAYARGYGATKAQLEKNGQMAALGMTKEDCQKILPPNTIISCYNSKTSVTISGPDQEVKDFVQDLSNKGVFARLVNSGNYAYHSKYVAPAAPHLRDFVKSILKEPKLRSSKWISTSNTEDKWDTELAKYNSGEYHAHNFANPVLFDQVYKYIPDNALIVEVSPHGLLQAILKRELPETVTNISITNRASEDNLTFFLSAIGKIYLNGGQPNLRNLYNNVSYPVGRGTPSIGSLIKWDHAIRFYIPYYHVENEFGKTISVDISEEKDAYFKGHTIDDRILLPAAGYMVLVWGVFAEMHMVGINKFPVVFENVKFCRATVLSTVDSSNLLINILKDDGYFEINESGSVIVTGYIRVPEDVESEFVNPQSPPIDKSVPTLKTPEVYREMHLRRYMYEGIFKGINELDLKGTRATLQWNNNWISFLDTMMQLTILQNSERDLFLPTGLVKFVIDPRKHLSQIKDGTIDAFCNTNLGVIKSGGVEIVRAQFSKAPKKQKVQGDPLLESFEFVPYESTSNEDVNISKQLKIVLGIILENSNYDIKLTTADESLKSAVASAATNEPFSLIKTLNYDKNASNQYNLLVLTELTEPLEKEARKITNNGYILYIGNADVPVPDNLMVAYKFVGNDKSVFLLRKTQPLPENTTSVAINTSNLQWIAKLQAQLKANKYDLVYLTSQEEENNGLMGLLKSLSREYGSNKLQGFLIEDKDVEPFSTNSNFYRQQLNKNLLFNVYKNHTWGSYRHLPLVETLERESSAACCTIMTPGDLSSFKWIERPLTYHKNIESKEFAIYYAALNFKDVMIASAKLQNPNRPDPTGKDLWLGFEFSAISKNGERVMGLTNGAALNLWLEVVDEGFTWKIPDSWTLEDAATVPVVYATAYYALIIRGNLSSNDSVLIHAGVGGVGLAAISIALSMGCKVFTTVSTEEKRQFLKERFPQIDENNIGNSRNKTFEQLIKQRTNGRGVDVVLNSLADDLFQTTLRCLAKGGRFLEIGKVDFFNNTLLDSNILTRNCSFHGVFLDELINCESQDKTMIKKLIYEGIESGVVRPLPRTVYNESEVEQAFRFLASGKHKGKVLIKIRDETEKQSDNKTLKVVPRTYFHSQKVFIIIGGLGGLGLELVQWLIERGATKIVLNSRRNVLDGYQTYSIKKFKALNVRVEVTTDDTSTIKGAENLISFAEKLGPVGGIFNLALVLKDALFENQTIELYEDVFKGKIVSGRNLDEVSRRKCPALDHFVVFSSIACGRGNAGQTNYSMANSALERLCERRQRDKLPALAIQWGPMGNVGYLEKVGRANENFMGTAAQNINSCFTSLDKFMAQSAPVVASVVLENKDDDADGSGGKSLIEAVAHIMGIKNVELVDEDATLINLGLDSLMTTEIRQILYRNYNIEMSVDDIRGLTFKKLAEYSNTSDEENTPNGDTEIRHDPIVPKEILVSLHTNGHQRNLFLIHSIEGHVDILRPLAPKLNANVYALQCTNEVNCDTINDHAKEFLSYVKSVQKQGPYILCGYSYGCALAVEMAIQMEKVNEVVSIICIDGSPVFVRDSLAEQVSKLDNNDQGHVETLNNFTKLFEDVDHKKAREILSKPGTWEDHIKNISEFLSKDTGIESEEIVNAAVGFYKRCRAGAKYTPASKVKGSTLLIRSNLDSKFTEDYGLGLMCEKTVLVHKVEGNHKSILHGDSLLATASLINTHIEAK